MGSTGRSLGRRLWLAAYEHRWALLGTAAVATLALGMWGFARVPEQWADRETSRDLLYRALQLFVLESGAVRPPVPWPLDVARLCAPAITALATAGLATRVVQELRAVAGRSIGRRRDHVIICGLGKKGRRLAAQFAKERGKAVVAIETGNENGPATVPARGWVTLKGDARDPEMLRRAGLKRAARLIAVCGSDGTNAEIAVAAARVAKEERTSDLPAAIHIANRELKRLLAPIEGAGDKLDTRLINVYELGADAMLAMAPSAAYGEEANGLLVVGLGEVGQCLTVKAASRGTPERRLKVYAIDLEATRKVEALRSLHPDLNRRWELVPIELNVDEHNSYGPDGELERLARAGAVAEIYVCIDDDPLALRTALELRKVFPAPALPIKVRTAEGLRGLASFLDRPGFEGIHAFGLLDAACTPEVFGADHVAGRNGGQRAAPSDVSEPSDQRVGLEARHGGPGGGALRGSDGEADGGAPRRTRRRH